MAKIFPMHSWGTIEYRPSDAAFAALKRRLERSKDAKQARAREAQLQAAILARNDVQECDDGDAQRLYVIAS